MKQCPKCGANCNDSDMYCGVCGAPLPMWNRVAPRRTGNGFAVASMVLGIVGLCTSWFFLGIVPAILAVVFSLIVLCSEQRRQNGRNMAITGLVTGILALVLFFVAIFFFIAVYDALNTIVALG